MGEITREQVERALKAALTEEEKRRAGVEAPEKVATWDADTRAWVSRNAAGDIVAMCSDRATIERWGYRIVGGPEQPLVPGLGLRRLVRLAREAKETERACEEAYDALMAAGERRNAALAALTEATTQRAILAAGGGK